MQSNYSLTDTDINLLRYGFKTLSTDFQNISCALFLSVLFDYKLHGFIYIITLSSLRRHSGGWHASKKIFCFLSYQTVFLIMIALQHIEWNIVILDILFLSAELYCVIQSPIEHIYNPLSISERSLNKIKLKRNIIIIDFLYLILHILNRHSLLFVICFASNWNMICMIMLKHSPMWRKV